MNPTFAHAHYTLGNAYIGLRRLDDAIDAHSKAYELSGTGRYLGQLGYVYGLAGRRADALDTLETLTDLAKHEHVSMHTFALLHFGLGNRDLAFEYLDRAIEARGNTLPYFKFAPMVDPLRSDPRFDAILKRMNFPADPPAPVVEPWPKPATTRPATQGQDP